MTDTEFIETLSKCRIWNYYAGLEDLRTQSMKAPSQALRIIWPFLISKVDPGNDDGQLCMALFELLTEAVGQQTMEELLLSEWPRLNDAVRRNFTWSVHNHKSVSLNFAVRLFDHPDTRTEQRHHIVAGLAAGDDRPRRADYVVDLAKRIGSYADPDRQAILDGFVSDVIRNYS